MKEKPLYVREIFNGHQAVFKFENGYGASVIEHDHSWGIELAVLLFTKDDNFTLCYDTPITSDVIGNMTEDEVKETLQQIKELV